MMNRASGYFSKLLADKKALLTVFLGLLGIILIFFSDNSHEDKAKEEVSSYSHSEYISQQERRVEKLISEIKGVGNASVMITYESGFETVYARDIDEQNESERVRYSSEIIVVDSGNDETGITVRENYPKVRGVAVVCIGGGNASVRSEITAIITALFDISSNCVSVTEMEI